MTFKNLFSLVSAASLISATAAQATTIDITFSYTDPGDNSAVNGVATLTATDLPNAVYLATSGSLVVTGGGAAGTYVLLPAGPGQTLSPFGAFNTDNLVIPGSDPIFTSNGLLGFTSASGGLELNLWGNYPGNYSLYTGYAQGSYPYTYDGPMAISATVPDGGSAFALLGVGLITVEGARRKLFLTRK